MFCKPENQRWGLSKAIRRHTCSKRKTRTSSNCVADVLARKVMEAKKAANLGRDQDENEQEEAVPRMERGDTVLTHSVRM